MTPCRFRTRALAASVKWSSRHSRVVVSPEAGGAAQVRLRVEVVEAMGFEAYAHGTVASAAFVARLEGAAAASLPSPGEALSLSVAPSAVHLFDPESGRAL